LPEADIQSPNGRHRWPAGVVSLPDIRTRLVTLHRLVHARTNHSCWMLWPANSCLASATHKQSRSWRNRLRPRSRCSHGDGHPAKCVDV